MQPIIEEALKLPQQEKLELLYALQDALHESGDYFEETKLTDEQNTELERREILIQKGEIKWMDREDFKQLLKERRNGLQSNKS